MSLASYIKILIIAFGTFLLSGCNRGMDTTLAIAGAAQGTTYHITYIAGEHSNYRASFDSIFRQIDLSLSTYDSGSIISKINRNDTNVTIDKYFSDVFHKSIGVSEKTNGLFDITVAPIINAYGFGFRKKERITNGLIDSLLMFVGYKKVRLAGNKLVKEKPQVMLDFNAIAQGYTVDVLASFLESKGIKNYMVEVGGELRAKGKKLNDSSWTVGIQMPVESDTEEAALFTTIRMEDKSLATSGNYNKFYVEEGKKYAHIIDPFTGYPAKHNLLSATVIAGDCMTADAYATSFMVMGLENSKQFLSENKDLGLEVFFIYDENGMLKKYATSYFDDNAETGQ